MDRFEELNTFVRVAETLNVTRAAEQLGIAPSAVSRRLRDLETRLGVTLLHRSTRRISLTDAGRTFYGRGIRLLGDMEEAEAEISTAQAALTGTLRLTVPLSLGLAALTEAVTDFMALHPALVVDIDLNDRLVDLVANNFDLAIRVGGLGDSTLIARRLTDVTAIVCASPDFIREHGMPAHPDDLSSMPALCYTNIPAPTVWRHRDGNGNRGEVRVTPRMFSSNGDALCDAAIAGLGVVCEPSFIVYRSIEQGHLVPLLTDFRWAEAQISALYPPTRHLPARARTFIDFLADRLGPEPYWERCLRASGERPAVTDT